jgi:hypothetical protein
LALCDYRALARRADAHCDTMGGPAAADGRSALTSGNRNHALKWIGPEAEAELREVFEPSLLVRALSGDGAAVADCFLWKPWR